MKRKDFMKLGVMFVCFSLAAGVPVFAAEQQPATKWQYTQKQDGILCVFDELKLKLPETWNGKFVTGVESGAITFYHKDSLNAGKRLGRQAAERFSLLIAVEIMSLRKTFPIIILWVAVKRKSIM